MTGPSTSKKKSMTRFEVKESDLVYNCEWLSCEEQFQESKEMLYHMAQHIQEYVDNLEEEDTSFDCGWRECGSQIEGNIHDFNRHVYFHAFHVKLKCIGEILIKKSDSPMCSIGRQSRNWIPELPEQLQCGWTHCGVICDNPLIFYSHVCQHSLEYPTGHTPNVWCQCQWTDCDLRFKTRYKLVEHLRSHTQEKVVACPICGGLFSNRTKFFDHLTCQKLSSGYCYQCSHCNKRFATERLLRDHMRHHVNHYKCPYCDMTCQAPSTLQNHIKYRHTVDRPFKCTYCDHRTKSAADLRKHVESHNSESIFSCHIAKCDYSARTYSSLAMHYKREHQIQNAARYACHICDQPFTRGSRLTCHLKVKHKFKWPPGHSRFRYKIHEDGTYRLQTIRYESIEVSEEVMEQDSQASSASSSNSREHDISSHDTAEVKGQSSSRAANSTVSKNDDMVLDLSTSGSNSQMMSDSQTISASNMSDEQSVEPSAGESSGKTNTNPGGKKSRKRKRKIKSAETAPAEKKKVSSHLKIPNVKRSLSTKPAESPQDSSSNSPITEDQTVSSQTGFSQSSSLSLITASHSSVSVYSQDHSEEPNRNSSINEQAMLNVPYIDLISRGIKNEQQSSLSSDSSSMYNDYKSCDSKSNHSIHKSPVYVNAPMLFEESTAHDSSMDTKNWKQMSSEKVPHSKDYLKSMSHTSIILDNHVPISPLPDSVAPSPGTPATPRDNPVPQKLHQLQESSSFTQDLIYPEVVKLSQAGTYPSPVHTVLNSSAYNLEMLGHVALLGQNLPKPQEPGDTEAETGIMENL